MDKFNLIASIASILSLFFGIYQLYEKKKLRLFTKSILQGTAGNICKIEQSANWASANIKDAMKLATELPDSENKKNLIVKISDSIGDAKASERMIINLLNEHLSAQEAEFGTREMKHPQQNDLTKLTGGSVLLHPRP